MYKNLLIIAAALAIASCGGNVRKADDPLADSGRTQRTENLMGSLSALGDSSAYLIGHQNATVNGVGWTADFSSDSTIHRRSDMATICNDHPALLGFDLAGIEQGDSLNADSIPFGRIRQEVVAHYDLGGVVTLSWTVTAPSLTADAISRVSAFLQSLETPYGVRVPVLFRLRGTTDKSCWQQTIEGIREADVTNALFVYSQPIDLSADASQYLKAYPGDALIDVMGLDSYCIADGEDTTKVAAFAIQLDRQLQILTSIAQQHHKVVALTETGYEGIKTPDFWTRTLAPVLAKHPIAYVHLWSNNPRAAGHYFVPFPGQHSVSDFIRFYNDHSTLLLHDINALYLSHHPVE